MHIHTILLIEQIVVGGNEEQIMEYHFLSGNIPFESTPLASRRDSEISELCDHGKQYYL